MSTLGGHKFSLRGASPDLVAEYLLTFLKLEETADIPTKPRIEEDQECLVHATVFVDYIPVGVAIRTFATIAGDTTLCLIHSSKNDLVRFNSLVQTMTSHLKSLGLELTSQSKSTGFASRLLDDNFDSELEDDVCDWSHCCESVDINAPTATMRQEAFQNLARWAKTTTRSHSAISRIFVESHLEMLLNDGASPIACLYPAASALRHICCKGCDTEACEILYKSDVFKAMEKLRLSSLPEIVSDEISKALHGIRLWKVYSSKFENHAASGSQGFLSGSTTCTNTDNVEQFDESDAEERIKWIQ